MILARVTKRTDLGSRLLGSDLYCCHHPPNPTPTPNHNVEEETCSFQRFHCIPCFAGGFLSSLKLHQFCVGRGPGDAGVVVMTGWLMN